jgi:hypothetical protein
MIRFGCPQCHQGFKAEDKSAGKRTKCPKCGTVLSVPNLAEKPVAAKPSVSEPAPRKPSASDSVKANTSNSPDDLPPSSAGDIFGLVDELPPLPPSNEHVGSFSKQPPQVAGYSIPSREENPAKATGKKRNYFGRFLGTSGGGNPIGPYKFGDRLSDRYPRLMGIVSIVAGLILAKWQIYDSLHAAEQHKSQVTIYSTLVAGAVFLPAYGVLLVLFGRWPIQWFRIDPQNLSVKNTVCSLLFAAIGIVVFLFVLSSLESQGFHAKNGW